MSKGTTAKRRLRRQAQRQQKHGNEEPMKQVKTVEAHFSIEQIYKITCDESPIDKHWVHVSTVDGKDDEEATVEYNAERKARSHRMYHAILGNLESLGAVLKYKTIREYDSSIEYVGYVEGTYGEDIDFYDILVKIAHIFTEEDREEVLDLPGDGDTRLLHFEDLENCFAVEPDGWCLHTHPHSH